MKMTRRVKAGVLLIICGSLFLVTDSVFAHFPWVTVEKEKVNYFFGENPADRTYSLPPTIGKAEILMRSSTGQSAVKTEMIETDDFIGKQSVGPVSEKSDVISQVVFGVYNGSKLQYYTQYLGGVMPNSFSACKPIDGMNLQAHAVDTDTGVDIYVLWKGKPLADADVTLFCDEGHQEGDGSTDKNGKVSFTDKEVEDGINGIVVGHKVADDSGQVGDQKYDSAMHYLTATFADPEDH